MSIPVCTYTGYRNCVTATNFIQILFVLFMYTGSMRDLFSLLDKIHYTKMHYKNSHYFRQKNNEASNMDVV